MSVVKRVNKVEDIVSESQYVTAKVISIDINEKRISLELVTDEKNPWADDDNSIENSIFDVVIESIKQNGIVVRLQNGMEGFAPRGELICGRNDDLSRIFKVGSTITLATKSINRDDKRLFMSQREVEKREEHESMKSYLKNNESAESSSIGSMYGSLFDDLKKKLN